MSLLLRAALALLLIVTPAFAAEIPSTLTRDLAPVSGVVILSTPAQTLIDRDAAHGVREGDLFAVVGVGEEIVHPVSGARLGRQTVVKGWLRVDKVRSGYAEAVPLATTVPLAVGDRVERFHEIEALLVDTAGHGSELYAALQGALPQLRWQGYFRSEESAPRATAAPRLTFHLVGAGLELREGQSGLLRRYPVTLAPAAAAVTVPPQAVADEYWNGPVWPGAAPVGVEVVDIDGDGALETIVAFRHGLEVGRFKGQVYSRVAQLEFNLSRNLLGIDAADSDGDGRPELWVTAENDGRLDSFVVVWDGKGLKETLKNLPWWLRAVDLPGQGRTLLAQRMGTSDFEGAIVPVTVAAGVFKPGSPLALPAGTRLYGLTRLENLTVRLTGDDHLQVFATGGELLYESDDLYGGSELFVPRPDPRLSGRDADVRHAYLSPRLEAVSGRTLLAPVNIGGRGMARQREFKQSRLDLLTWDGMTLRVVRPGRIEPGWLVDFRRADVDNDGTTEIVSLIELTSPGFFGKGRSGLIVREAALPQE